MAEIIFTLNVKETLQEVLHSYTPENIFVLTDTNSKEKCLPLLGANICPKIHQLTVEPGETHKSVVSLEKIWTMLTECGAKRSSVLVNVGGGLITDLGGFAAACFKRGIHCVNVPTTLLSQVDASVGGKTGVNFCGLKNEIGVFSMPDFVLIDTHFLTTLPMRQILSGFAEMLKHGLLKGGAHLEQLLTFSPKQIHDEVFIEMLHESVTVKQEIVTEDPQEHGIRKALNLGHTVGHAIESLAIERGEELYHGEAVAYGLVAELLLSVRQKGFSPELYQRVKDVVYRLYSSYLPVTDFDTLYGLMLHDKKNSDKGVNFTLLETPGKISIDNYCSRDEIQEVLREVNYIL